MSHYYDLLTHAALTVSAPLGRGHAACTHS